jgi:hypothetical protein
MSSIKQIYPDEYDKIIQIIQNEVINSLVHRDTNDFKD